MAIGMNGDFRELRGVLEEVVGAVALGSLLALKPCQAKWAQSAVSLTLDGQPFGIAGILNADIAKEYNLDKQIVSMCEFDFGMLMDKAGGIPTAKPLPRFPSIVRDLSLIVDEPVSWADVMGVVGSQDIAILEDVQFGGIYRGKPIEKGQKSLTVSFCFRDEQGTLTHETVDGYEKQLLNALKAKLGAELRTA